MKIRMLQCLSGANFCHDVGAEPDFPKAEAARLIAAGIAERVAAKPKGETTSKAAPKETR